MKCSSIANRVETAIPRRVGKRGLRRAVERIDGPFRHTYRPIGLSAVRWRLIVCLQSGTQDAKPCQAEATMTATVNETLLDERLGSLEKARAWSARLVSKLESHIRSADDEALVSHQSLHLCAGAKPARGRGHRSPSHTRRRWASSAWIGCWSARNALASSRASTASRASATTITAASARSATKRRSTTISPSPSPSVRRFERSPFIIPSSFRRRTTASNMARRATASCRTARPL